MNESDVFVRENFIKDLFIPKDILGAFDIIDVPSKVYEELRDKDLLGDQQIILNDCKHLNFETVSEKYPEIKDLIIKHNPGQEFIIKDKVLPYYILKDDNITWDYLKDHEDVIVFPDYRSLEKLPIESLHKIEFFLSQLKQAFLTGFYVRLDNDFNMYFSFLAPEPKGKLFHDNSYLEINKVRRFIDAHPKGFKVLSNYVDLDARLDLMGTIRRSHYIEGVLADVSY